eukprot:2095248-Rhodomonas_salina.1
MSCAEHKINEAPLPSSSSVFSIQDSVGSSGHASAAREYDHGEHCQDRHSMHEYQLTIELAGSFCFVFRRIPAPEKMEYSQRHFNL